MPPEGLETMLRRPEMEAMPPPTGWELWDFFFFFKEV